MTYNLEKEKQEAIDAGNRALRSLREAQDNLNSTKNWGIWDMFGGGFISTMAKHSKMDRAKQNMEQVISCPLLTGSLTVLLWTGWFRIESIRRPVRLKKQYAE